MDALQEMYDQYLISCSMKRTALEHFPSDFPLEQLYKWCKSFISDYNYLEYYKKDLEREKENVTQQQ